MKKLLVLLMALMMIVVCSACSNKDDSSKSDSSGTVGSDSNAKSSRFASVAVGDIITFGHYEQDNNLDNGQEPIEWIVLDVKDGKALLLSRYGLEAKPFNTDWMEVTWETCTLRPWLNNEFLSKAFSAGEKSAILTTEVDNSSAQAYRNTPGGNNTQDMVFLLSYAESNRYLDVTLGDRNNTKSRVAPTTYAIANGARTDSECQTADGRAAGWWWLRSPESPEEFPKDAADGDISPDSDFAKRDVAMVFYNGSLGYFSVDKDYVVVRPALWVNLNSGI